MSEQFDVKKTLNSICEEVVFLDVDDKKSLGRVLNGIESLKNWAEENEHQQTIIILETIIQKLEDLILDESTDFNRDIQLISAAASEIQKMVENNYSDNELVFPDELKSTGNSTNSEKSNNEQLTNNIIDLDILSDFILKQKIELEEYDELLIGYEESGNQEYIAELKRKIHNLKGESAIIGITDIEKLCHKIEDWLLQTENVDTDQLFKIVDWLKNKFLKLEGNDIELSDVDDIINQLFTAAPKPKNKIIDKSKIITNHIPENVDEDIFSDFLTEQITVMENLEDNILKLNSDEKEHALSEIKRIMHTLKGEANLMGLLNVGNVCHDAETFISKNDQITEFLFVLKDWMSETFDYYSGNNSKLPTNEKVDQFFNILEKPKEVTESTPGELEPIDDMELLVDFLSEAEEHLETANSEMLAFEESEDVEKINGIFRAFHTIKGVAGFLNLNDVRILSHSAEDLLDKIRKQKITLTDATTDIIYKSIDKLKELMQSLAEYAQKGVKPPPNPSVQNIINNIDFLLTGKKSEEVAKPIEKKSPKIKETIDESQQVDDVEPVQVKDKSFGNKKNIKIKENIKVDAARLDHLIDFIGELAIAASMLTQSQEIKDVASSEIMKKMNRLDKITKEVQSTSMSLRMVTVRSTFQKMARLVRDLSKKSGKLVEFKMFGEDTELDKNVVEQIGDPLVHLIRNAVDHGIESNIDDRIKNNKPKEGHVSLRAFHKGGNIYIEIEDDGKGLDKEAIIKKAIEKEIITSTSNLKENEIWNLVFEPGFSTAKKVTDVSGRGVGMDVVKKNIEAMRGHVNIKSEKGKGSVFSIILPLTLAIIDGMVIKVGTERYIIPTLSVISSIRPNEDQYFTAIDKGEMIKFQNNLIPLFRLSEHFGIEATVDNVCEGIVVIVESGLKKLGILVDNLLGQQQIVIKSLKGDMKDIKGISGGAIMPDGTVALILDIGGILELTTTKINAIEV